MSYLQLYLAVAPPATLQEMPLIAMTTQAQPQPKTLKELMAEYEIKIINQHVAQYGTLRKAAAVLGVSHSLLSYKLKKHYESGTGDIPVRAAKKS